MLSFLNKEANLKLCIFFQLGILRVKINIIIHVYKLNFHKRKEFVQFIIDFFPINRDMANFEPMLATLDKNKERLKIKSYGISDTTLEEVIVEILIS